MARLSIIIPVLGDPQKLDDTLVSVLENRPAHCEILVVHNEPYDDPYQLSNEVSFVAAWRGATLGDCLNLGMAASRAPLLHILSCGVEASPGWTETALRRFRDPNVAAVAPIVVYRDQREVVASAGLSYRTEGTVLRLGQGETLFDVAARNDDPCGPDLLAAFYRKAALESVGGFSTWACDLLVGGDLALHLYREKLCCVLEPNCLTHVAPALAADRPGFVRGRDAEQFFWRWARCHKATHALVGHLAMLTGEAITSLLRPRRIAHLLGRTWGVTRTVLRRPQPAAGFNPELPAILPGPFGAAAEQREESGPTSRVA